jgi:hypothetical protein
LLCYDSCFVINSRIIYMSWCMPCSMEIFCGFIFLIFLCFAENVCGIRWKWSWREVWPAIEQLITEFADGKEEPQGLPSHRGHLDHKVKLNGYPHRQRTNWLPLPEYEEVKRQLIKELDWLIEIDFVQMDIENMCIIINNDIHIYERETILMTLVMCVIIAQSGECIVYCCWNYTRKPLRPQWRE